MNDPLYPVFGIDQATGVSGWCCLVQGRIEDMGTIRKPSSLSGLDAAIWMVDALEREMVNHNVGAIAVEDLHLQRFFKKSRKKGDDASPVNARTIFLLGNLQGALAHVAHQHGYLFSLVTSPEVCAHLGIPVNTPRDEKKRAARQIAASELYGDRTRYLEIPEDAADAVAISEIAYRKLLVSARTVV